LNGPVEFVIGTEIRRFDEEALPLTLGGPGNDLPLQGIDSEEPAAFIGFSEGQFFVQSNGDETVQCNGTPVVTSQWLYDGDVLGIGPSRIHVGISEQGARFTVRQPSAENLTAPPTISAGSRSQPTDEAERRTVKPVQFKPVGSGRAESRRRASRPRALLVWLPLLALVLVAWFLFSSRSVEIVIEPEPDRMEFEGGLFGFDPSYGGRHLARPGIYSLVAEKEGYRRMELELEVTREPSQSYRFNLEKLPGLLAIDVGSVEGAEIVIDGVPSGVTPQAPLELSPGEHEVRIRSERYEEAVRSVSIEGGGAVQSLDIELIPRWARIGINSRPAGAGIRVDGAEVGTTPATVELIEGTYKIELTLAGHKRHSRRLEVVANKPQMLATIALVPADGRMTIRSEPGGATVTVDGIYRGLTPLDLFMQPGDEFEVELSKVGHETQTRSVSLRAGGSTELDVTLPAVLGEISIVTTPDGAELYVNGEPRGEANQTLRLVAVPHEIEVRKEGYEPFRVRVIPRPDFVQAVPVALKSLEQVQAEITPPLISTSQGQEMVLVEGGRFRMGASRREPGRRSNETLRDVELTRRFYIATEEVSNGEFREFKSKHRSGRVGGVNLEPDHHPVVRVTWEQAALYCNWLSGQESLPPAYEKRNGRLELILPPTIGYRLPTEAEWAFVARNPVGSSALKYPWGESLPVPPESGNYGDASAEELLSDSIDGYDDRHPGTAPVGSFEPNALGLFNLGGNVGEWVSDHYTVYPSRTGEVAQDPLGPARGESHVIRGAGWMDSVVSELRLSYREYGVEARPDVGFRIARYAE